MQASYTAGRARLQPIKLLKVIDLNWFLVLLDRLIVDPMILRFFWQHQRFLVKQIKSINFGHQQIM